MYFCGIIFDVKISFRGRMLKIPKRVSRTINIIKMKRNLFLIAVLIVAAVSLSACKKSNISMKPETTKISGDLAECFEVVDEGVDVKLKDGKLELFESVWRVKVRRTDAPLPFEEGVLLEEYGSYRTDGQAYYLVGFGLRIEGADGDVVQENKATEGGLGGPYSHDDVEGLLKLKPGEVGEIRWSVDDKCLDAEEPLKFKISSAYELVGNPSTSACESISPIAGSGDVDALLNQFESTVNRLSKMNWLTDDNYDAVEEKALQLYEKLIKMEMTPEQEKRFDEIDDKFDKA